MDGRESMTQEQNPCSYSYLMFDKKKKSKVYIGKKTASSPNGVGKTGYSHIKESK